MRWLLLLALAYLIWRLLRTLRRRPSPPPVANITDLRACHHCGTYVDTRGLHDGRCAKCQSFDR